MTDTIGRRDLLAVMAGMPLLAALPAPLLAATAAPTATVSRIAATPIRQVEISRWAARGTRAGTIAFSHGFGSSPRFYPDFVQAWTAAGYDIVAPLHVDSREYPQTGAFTGLAGWAARIEDMRAVSRLIGGPYVAAGHSFGALTALVLCGVGAVVPPGIKGPLADKHARAALAFSPPGPMPTLVSEQAFATLARPALIQTGTRDVATPAADPQSWRAHFTAFAQAPATGDHHGLILDGVDHYFGGLICDPSKTGPDQRVALGLATEASLAFLARYDAPPARKVSGVPKFPVSPLARFYTR